MWSPYQNSVVILFSCCRMVLQISPYLVAGGSGCYAPYYGAPAAPSPVVIPSSAPALTEATPAAPPTSLAQPCPHPEVLHFHSLVRSVKQVAQLSQRDRAAGWVSYGQKWKTGTGRQYLRSL